MASRRPRRARRTRLHSSRIPGLRAALDELIEGQDAPAHLAADPLAFVHAWSTDPDREVAALLAASLAFGRVAAFWPVLDALFARASTAGGPRAWAEGFGRRDADAVASLRYRWLGGEDLALFVATLGEALRRHGSLGELLTRHDDPRQATVQGALEGFVGALREHASAAAERLGLSPTPFRALPRGFRYLLPVPSAGSACKRWCMLLRWMGRPAGDRDRVDGLDLGLWPLDPARLVIPLDTHVHRMALLLGLTRRVDGSWRTALEVTENLRRIDSRDPLRFDFALAHLGISGACTVRQHGDRPPARAVCAACSLAPLCRVGRAGDKHGSRAATG